MIISDSLNYSTFLVDTCFFIDAYSRPKDFRQVLSEINSKNIALVSLNLVKVEFVRARTIDVVNQKTQYFDELINNLLPFTQELDFLALTLMQEYKNYLEGVSITDLYLGACLKKYKGLYLLTRNHKDFPTSVFYRSFSFTIESDREVRAYSLYQYKTDIEEIPF